jgi:ribosomal protein L13E
VKAVVYLEKIGSDTVTFRMAPGSDITSLPIHRVKKIVRASGETIRYDHHIDLIVSAHLRDSVMADHLGISVEEFRRREKSKYAVESLLSLVLFFITF